MKLRLQGNRRNALLWAVVVLGFTISIGAGTDPGWWKRFLFKGGLFQGWYWADALTLFGRGLKGFHPSAVAMVAVVFALVGAVVFFLGRRAAGTQGLPAIPAPPPVLLLLVVVVTPLVLLALPFSEQEYWTLAEMSRMLDVTNRRVQAMKLPGHVTLPTSGDFLYLDRERVLAQYAVLHDSLSVTGEITKEGAESKTGATGTLPGVGSVGVETKSNVERSVTRTAPDITAPLAAARLIAKFSSDEDVVQLGTSYYEGSEYRSILEGLEKRGVKLSVDQKAQLEKAEIKDFEAKTLRLTDRRPLFLRGKLSIVPRGNAAALVASIREPLSINLTGQLKRDYLSSHIRTCIEIQQSCELVLVTVLGVMESVESPSANVRKVTISPIAIW